MKIIYTSKFERSYRKLPDKIKNIAKRKEKLFRLDPFSKTLETHKLYGKFSDFWSFSVDYKYRVIFEFGTNNVAFFHSIGNYDIYK